MKKSKGTWIPGALLSVILPLALAPEARAAVLPTVEYYRASPTTITKIQAVRLWWKVQNAARVDVYDGFRNTTYGNLGNENYIEVWPERTADYILYAYAGDGQYVTSTLTIAVHYPDPIIDYFNASVDYVPTPQNVRLYWRVRDASRVDVNVNDGYNNRMFTNVGADAFVDVWVERNTACVLYAYSQGGKIVSRQLTLTTTAATARIEQFTVSSASIRQGQPVSLGWRVQGATRIDIQTRQGLLFGSLPPEGTVQAFPERTTQYVLYAYGPNGQASTAFARVEVVP